MNELRLASYRMMIGRRVATRVFNMDLPATVQVLQTLGSTTEYVGMPIEQYIAHTSPDTNRTMKEVAAAIWQRVASLRCDMLALGTFMASTTAMAWAMVQCFGGAGVAKTTTIEQWFALALIVNPEIRLAFVTPFNHVLTNIQQKWNRICMVGSDLDRWFAIISSKDAFMPSKFFLNATAIPPAKIYKGKHRDKLKKTARCAVTTAGMCGNEFPGILSDFAGFTDVAAVDEAEAIEGRGHVAACTLLPPSGLYVQVGDMSQ